MACAVCGESANSSSTWGQNDPFGSHYLLFGHVVAMLVNVFVPHVSATIVFRSPYAGRGDACAN
jgi:hypothetical protein